MRSSFNLVDVSDFDIESMAAVIWVLDGQFLKLDLSANHLHNNDVITFRGGSKLLEYLLFGFFPRLLNFPEILFLLDSIFCGDCVQTCSELPLLDSLESFSFPCVLVCHVDAGIVHMGHLLFQCRLDLGYLHWFRLNNGFRLFIVPVPGVNALSRSFAAFLNLAAVV